MDGSTSLPAASLIVSSRDRPRMLMELVTCVLAGDEVPDEVVVVDQSREPHPVLSNGLDGRVRYVWSHSVGLSRSRNIGIREARHDVVAFTDDDIRIPRTWFGTLRRGLVAAGSRSVVVGRVVAGEPEVAGAFSPSGMLGGHAEHVVYAGRIGRDVIYANMALPRSAFDEVGLFDERLGVGARFPSSEDNDLGFRLLEAGYRIVTVPEAVVYHRAWRPPADYIPLRWRYGRGQGAYYAKHVSLRDKYMLRRFGWDVRRHLRRIPSRTLSNMRRQACGDLAYVAGLVAGAAEWLAGEYRPI
jgi:GT2 family glycosyltransferase